jgi:hypothetical protein
MEQIISAIEGAVNAFLSNPLVMLAGRAVVIYVVLLWLASAYWAYRDLQSRTPNPIAPYLAAVIIIFFTPILFPFGLVLYKLVRPGETVAEANERALAQEAMLREMPILEHCEGCERRVEPEWVVCPSCRIQLRRTCPSCGRKVELDWLVCAWCGHDPNLPLHAAVTATVFTPERISRRRPVGAIGDGALEPAREVLPAPSSAAARPVAGPSTSEVPDAVAAEAGSPAAVLPAVASQPSPAAPEVATPPVGAAAVAGRGSTPQPIRAPRSAPAPRTSRR